jgi:hypothetical protein
LGDRSPTFGDFFQLIAGEHGDFFAVFFGLRLVGEFKNISCFSISLASNSITLKLSAAISVSEYLNFDF